MPLATFLDTFPAGPLVLDASTIFNLLGCGKPVEVVQALQVPCLIEEHTLKEIKRHPIPGLCHKEVLSSLVGNGSVSTYRMSLEAYELYLSLISGKPSECLDDGESAAIATAVSLGYGVMLDDGKARRVHRSRFPATSFASSLRLFLTAGQRSGWNYEDVHRLIFAARANARMNIVTDDKALFASLGLFDC